jgi:hypothetical protein
VCVCGWVGGLPACVRRHDEHELPPPRLLLLRGPHAAVFLGQVPLNCIYYTILYYTILYYILYYTILYYTILYYTILY